ncbi:MAG: NACHT domain-containing protein, partial [Planctomycetes bacterium]|nr:NACHT domain-containing protein [Planctomycetota bacterium]
FNKQGIYGKAEKAFLVTNGEFAPEAVEVAKNLDVEVHTQADMVKNLMDFGPYLKGLVNDFRNSHLYGHYIDICSITGENLSEEVLTLLYEDDEQAVVVLGDYGCGKTSLCMKLCSDLANDILSGKEAPLPVLIQLREYTKAFDMEELITNMLVNKWRIPNGNFSTFMELVKHGRVILIFDGFDEIARRVDYSVKYKVFNEICKFATNNSKLLVTCRPNFFNQREEFERLFKSSPLYFEPNDRKVRFAEVESEELTKDQIKQYIVSYGDDLTTKGYRVPDFLDVLENTHDLWDLAKRPVLLNVLMDTIPELTPKKGTKINAAGLYDIYTRFWLDREDKKGKTLIKSSDKLLFTEQLAKEMFTKNELSINFTKLPLVV